jgi:hypothetical protein
MQRTLLVGLAAFCCAMPAIGQARIMSSLGVSIQSCVVNSNGGSLTNGVNIVYSNTHASPATEVDFLVGYHGHKYVLIDRGSFSQGAQINHNLDNALVGLPWHGPRAKLCTVQRVMLANGQILQ